VCKDQKRGEGDLNETGSVSQRGTKRKKNRPDLKTESGKGKKTPKLNKGNHEEKRRQQNRRTEKKKQEGPEFKKKPRSARMLGKPCSDFSKKPKKKKDGFETGQAATLERIAKKGKKKKPQKKKKKNRRQKLAQGLQMQQVVDSERKTTKGRRKSNHAEKKGGWENAAGEKKPWDQNFPNQKRHQRAWRNVE